MITKQHGAKVYVDEIPKCDFCEKKSYADAKLCFGPWAYVCQTHFDLYGCKLGMGVGQKLKLMDNKSLDKINVIYKNNKK